MKAQWEAWLPGQKEGIGRKREGAVLIGRREEK